MSTQYGLESTLESYAAYYGPSYMINPMTNSYGGYNVEIGPDQLPLPGHARLVHAAVRRDREEADRDVRRAVATSWPAKFTEGIGEGFLQDVEIWKNKTKIENPLLCDEDGPVYQLRRWYEQFYVDVADVTEKMTQRFEFEVDTTKANESWEKEVDENLARKAAEEKSGKQEAEV